MRFIFATLFWIMSAAPVFAQTAPTYVSSHVPEARFQGEGRLRVYGLNVYDAALYAPQGKAHPERPLAIEITYLRDLSKERIVNRSLDEMATLGASPEQLDAWGEALTRIIPDVSQGTRITGVRTDNGSTIFYKDGQKIGTVADAAFSEAFFDIWLSEKTSSPSLRKKLLSGNILK